LHVRFEAARAKLREADTALVKGQLGDGRPLYLEADKGFRDVAAGLNEHIAGLLAAGKRELEAGHPEEALEKAQQILELHPGDEAALKLKQQADIGSRVAKKGEQKNKGQSGEPPLPASPPEVQAKLDKAWRAVAEAIAAAQDAGLVDSSIDPPPILDILINGYAIDAKTLKNPAAKKTFWAVTPEVFCAWFTGYNKPLDGVTINPLTDLRIVMPSEGLKAWYDQRAIILNKHLKDVKEDREQPNSAEKEEGPKGETAKGEPTPREPKDVGVAVIPTVPKEVKEKLEKARHAVAQAIVAAEKVGLVDSSIDPPPILDILITGQATEARTLRNPALKRPFWDVTPEVFCGWFCGYGKLEGVSINPVKDLRIMNPSSGLKSWFDRRASLLNYYLVAVKKK